MGMAGYPIPIKQPRETIKKMYLVLLLFHVVSFILREKSFIGETMIAEQTTAMLIKNQVVNNIFDKYTDCQ